MDHNMQQVKQDTKYHRCGLSGESWDIVTRFIDGGIFVHWRRAIKRFTMIDTRHPLTLSYAPSLSKLKQEEKSHLIENYSMIHPLSMFSFYLNMIIAIIIIFYLIFGPIATALIRNRLLLTCLKLPLNLSHLVLIFVTFFTGHYDDSRNIVLMKKEDVLKKYLRTYLITDLLAFSHQILNLPMIKTVVLIKEYVLPLLIILRYIRYIWCLKVLKAISLYYGISIFIYKTGTLLLNTIIGLVVAVYVLYTTYTEEPTYNAVKFVGHARTTLKMIFMVDHGRSLNSDSDIDHVVIPIAFIMAGFIFHLAITVQIMEIWFRYFSAENQQNNVYNSINAYMRYKALPVSLRKRVYLYLEFKYQGHFFKDSVIRKATSSYLRREILLAATKESTQNVELFLKIPGPVLRKIRAVLESEIYLPGDVIIKAGSPGQCMFFLVAGTVVITNSEDRVICYLRDGSHFGEIALVVNQARVANVIAVSPCELYKLDRESFSEVVKKYPEVWKEIELTAADRIVKAQQVSSSQMPAGLTRKNAFGLSRDDSYFSMTVE